LNKRSFFRKEFEEERERQAVGAGEEV